jgi:hypothetical protein
MHKIADTLPETERLRIENRLFSQITRYYTHNGPCTQFDRLWICLPTCLEANIHPTYDIEYDIEDRENVADDVYIFQWKYWHQIFNTLEEENEDEEMENEEQFIIISDEDDNNEAEMVINNSHIINTLPIQCNEISSTT